jgi:hypothetical protein
VAREGGGVGGIISRWVVLRCELGWRGTCTLCTHSYVVKVFWLNLVHKYILTFVIHLYIGIHSTKKVEYPCALIERCTLLTLCKYFTYPGGSVAKIRKENCGIPVIKCTTDIRLFFDDLHFGHHDDYLWSDHYIILVFHQGYNTP